MPLGSLAGQCLSCIEMALCHPASKGGLAEQLQVSAPPRRRFLGLDVCLALVLPVQTITFFITLPSVGVSPGWLLILPPTFSCALAHYANGQCKAQRAGLQLAMQPITDGDSGIAGDSLATAEEAYALMQGHGMGPGFKSSLKINASVFTPTGPEVGAPTPLQPTRPAPSRPANATPVGAPVGAPPVGAIGSAAFMSTADSLLLSLENMPSQQHSQKVRLACTLMMLVNYAVLNTGPRKLYTPAHFVRAARCARRGARRHRVLTDRF